VIRMSEILNIHNYRLKPGFLHALVIVTIMIFSKPLMAQELRHDTISDSSEHRNNQNVMLNATSTSQPRFISLGMPQWGIRIMEDRLPTSMYGDFFPGYWSWHDGLGTESMQLTTLDESALQLGVTGFFASTTSKTGSDKMSIALNYSFNQYGRQQIDINLATPIRRGWGLSINAYQDLDRGSNHLDVSYLQQHIQYYKVGLFKNFAQGRGLLKMAFQYMNSYIFNFPYGPFIFVGNGKIKEYGDFNLGHDQYFPSTPTFDYIDVKSGKKKTKRFVQDCSTPMYLAMLKLCYTFLNQTTLDVSSHLKTGYTNIAEPYLSSIDNVGADDGYSYANGKHFDGKMQTCFLTYHNAHYSDWMTTAILKGKRNKYQWMTGINIWLSKSDDACSTSNFAYEAKKDPKALFYNGENYYVYNTGALYYDGSQTTLAAFAQNQWNVNAKWNLRAGLRIEYSGMRGNSANNINGKTNNSRCADWYLMMTGVSKTPINVDNLNGAATFVATWNLNRNVSFYMNGIATQQHSELWQYNDVAQPSQLPHRTYMFRAGIDYNNNWINLQSLIFYITQKNNYQTQLYTHELTYATGGYPAGYKESLFVPSTYSMEAMGWTTDIILKPFKGFSFHGLFTLRNPRYSDFKFKPVFSDGYTALYDFSKKAIVSTSNVEIELEPTYDIKQWHLWISARYYSRQYINITNSLYFNARWETFGGIDYKLNKQIELNVNIVNFLNQKGAKAGIQAASLATDANLFNNYLTSGTYIRPFTIEIGTKIHF
jgi:hypothetical protein